MDPFLENYCEKCPRQCDLLQRQVDTVQAKEDMVDFVSDALMGEAGAKFDTMIDALQQLDPRISPSLKQGIRADYADDIADYDATYKHLDELRQNLAKSCLGPLNMRATKNNLEFTVSVCTSRHATNTDATSKHIPTHTNIRKL